MDGSPVPPQADPNRFGPLVESFVGAELRKLIGWSQARVTLSHLRTKDGDVGDFVLEDQRGRIIGIEVKASATLRRGDFSGLRKLEAAAGDKFVRGLVLHDHDVCSRSVRKSPASRFPCFGRPEPRS